MKRKIRKHIRKVRSAARDGMWLSVLALVVLVLFAHPGRLAELAIALGLAGVLCARISRRPGTGAARPVTRQQARPAARVRYLSPECLASECGSCSGVGCDHGCGHPGRARTRRVTAPMPADPEY